MASAARHWHIVLSCLLAVLVGKVLADRVSGQSLADAYCDLRCCLWTDKGYLNDNVTQVTCTGNGNLWAQTCFSKVDATCTWDNGNVICEGTVPQGEPFAGNACYMR